MIGARAISTLCSPALVLFLLSPVFGELVSSVLTPLEFFNPVRLAITLVPYGCAAIAARELVIRRKKGFTSLVLLGLAFGLIFEGIVTRVLFNPSWEGLGSLASYGRAHGFSWVLAVGLEHFHVLISIVCPVLTAEALFPTQRKETWVPVPLLVLCCCAVPAWTFIMGVFVPYFPPFWHAVALTAIAVGLVVLADCIPKEPLAGGARRIPSPAVFGGIGGVGMTLTMVGTFIVPDWGARPAASIMFFALLTIMLIELGALVWLSNGGDWNDCHRLALVLGSLAFFLAFGVLKDLESFAGHSLVSGVALWRLFRLLRLRGTALSPST